MKIKSEFEAERNLRETSALLRIQAEYLYWTVILPVYEKMSDLIRAEIKKVEDER